MSDGVEGAPLADAEMGVHVPASVIMPPPFNGDSEEGLALRFGRVAKPKEELVYEFTRDVGLLQQYYRLYEEQFIAIYKAQRFCVVEDDHDRNGYIMVAKRGNQCVGGARICITTPRSFNFLPLEIKDFRLKEHFPDLERKQLRYGQLSRFVVLPEFRRGNVTREMFRRLYQKVVTLNLDVVFAAAPIANARSYRLNCMAMGLKDVKIYTDITLPNYPGYEEVKHYLISGVIDKSLLDTQRFTLEKEEWMLARQTP